MPLKGEIHKLFIFHQYAKGEKYKWLPKRKAGSVFDGRLHLDRFKFRILRSLFSEQYQFAFKNFDKHNTGNSHINCFFLLFFSYLRIPVSKIWIYEPVVYRQTYGSIG